VEIDDPATGCIGPACPPSGGGGGGGGISVVDSNPVLVSTSVRFTAISAGSAFTCGISEAAAAYCWGDNGQGQIGEGAIAASYAAPIAVAGGLRFAQLVAGLHHTCGVSQVGVVYCWGDNASGQLGDSSTIDRAVPTEVAGNRTYLGVTAGGRSCGFVAGGATYCWGARSVVDAGQPPALGADSFPVLASSTVNFTQLSGGATFQCGTSTGSRAFCWGLNESGQLGNGLKVFSATPVQIASALTITATSASLAFDKKSHACALVQGGGAICWGDNSKGQLGNGTTVSSTTPVVVSGGLSFANISTGAQFTCGVTLQGAGYCWGRLLGNGTTNSASVPVQVSGNRTWSVIDAGATHACGVTGSGAAYCWGSNAKGELGKGP
jgi:alpha-tubulin suppressor-like RCC1 family protein